MNILNTGHLFAKGRGAGAASGEAMGVMVDQNTIDPEMLKLLGNLEGENSTEEGFANILKNLSAEEQKTILESLKNTEVENIPELSKKELVEKLLEQGTKKAQEPVVLKQSDVEIQNLLKMSKPEVSTAKSIDQDDSANIIELKKELKNIFANKSAKGQPVKTDVIKEATLNKNEPLNLVKPESDFKAQLQSRMAQKAYTSDNKSLFNKTDQTSAQVIRADKPDSKLQDVMFSESNSSEFSDNLDNKNMFTKDGAAKNTAIAGGTAKVFDMNTFKPATQEQVITKIQDYIMQTQASNTPKIEMSFNHSELGKVDLMVQRDAARNISVMINTNTPEGAEFFQQKQSDLLGSLARAGLNISDFKLESSSTSNNQNSSSDSSKGQGFANNQKHQHQSESGQRQQESQKREELWNLLRDKEAA